MSPQDLTAPAHGPTPELGGPTEARASERASATPTSTTEMTGMTSVTGQNALDVGAAPEARLDDGPLADPRHAAGAAVRRAPAANVPLDILERWLARVITDPVSAKAGIGAASALLREREEAELESIVRPGPGLSALDRLGIYQHAYHARLVECLADDYPATARALGAEAFAALARRYIAEYPSRSFNLNIYGEKFPSFCAANEPGVVADLARLEWAIVEVFHARADEPLSLDTLRAIPPERWPDVRFTANAALRLEEFAYPVNRYFAQARRAETPPELPARAWSATAIYRRGHAVWRMDFTPAMARVLKALLAGETLGDALAPLEVEACEDDVMTWFQAWVEGGFFASIAPAVVGAEEIIA